MYRTGNYIVTVPPASEPLSLTEVKTWLKISGSDEDDLLSSLIAAAREAGEKYCGVGFGSQTVTEKFPDLDQCGMALSVSPVIAVSSISYKDTAGDTQTLSTSYYGVDTQRKPGMIYPIPYKLFPLTYDTPDAVTVTYTAGYTTIPDAVKTAMLLMIADWYDNRTDGVRTMPTASQLLLNPYRVWTF